LLKKADFCPANAGANAGAKAGKPFLLKLFLFPAGLLKDKHGFQIKVLCTAKAKGNGKLFCHSEFISESVFVFQNGNRKQ
jgi:hypothetical protein